MMLAFSCRSFFAMWCVPPGSGCVMFGVTESHSYPHRLWLAPLATRLSRELAKRSSGYSARESSSLLLSQANELQSI